MINFHEKRSLGKTGLMAGRLGISSSYGAPSSAFEEAFERGCNYFTWGTFIKGRSSAMAEAVRNINQRGDREKLILAVLSYAHSRPLTAFFLERGLKKLRIDYADILLLGYFSKRPPQRVIDGALQLKQRGLIRHIGITSHNRDLFRQLAQEDIFDIFHIRYSAAHPGAENDVFPMLPAQNKPGIVSFTATAWSKLLNASKMPPGEKPCTPSQCYRFVLSNPSVDICMMGAKTLEQMRENLDILDSDPLTDEELERVRRIGQYIYVK